jgi:hypothetical protein
LPWGVSGASWVFSAEKLQEAILKAISESPIGKPGSKKVSGVERFELGDAINRQFRRHCTIEKPRTEGVFIPAIASPLPQPNLTDRDINIARTVS